ncbi:MAG: large-conductance mechanosensitive channel protein MscL [Candidatus Cyclobacteriaceae bacterium M2_1C_046]
MKKFIKGFKEFAVKGNVVDLAIGIVIGTAFNRIVQSFVKDIIMPPFGLIWGDKNFTNYKIILKPAELTEAGEIAAQEVAITYGNFITATVDFLIIGFSIYFVIQVMNSTKRKAEDPKNPEVPTPKDIQLLTEIRDLLSKDKKQ